MHTHSPTQPRHSLPACWDRNTPPPRFLCVCPALVTRAPMPRPALDRCPRAAHRVRVLARDKACARPCYPPMPPRLACPIGLSGGHDCRAEPCVRLLCGELVHTALCGPYQTGIGAGHGMQRDWGVWTGGSTTFVVQFEWAGLVLCCGLIWLEGWQFSVVIWGLS